MDQYAAYLNKRAWMITSEASELVSNKQFVSDHLKNLNEFRDCLILYAPDNGMYTIYYFALNGLISIGSLEFPNKYEESMCEFVGDVDGLVCLLFEGDNVAVFNPILDKWNIPPEIPSGAPVQVVTQLSHGFGKDSDGDYKIVRLREREEHKKIKAREIAVFSFSSGVWSVKTERFTNNIGSLCPGQCVDGTMYFLCSSCSDLEDKPVLSAINLSDLATTQLEVPNQCSHENFLHLDLIPLHDHLGLVQSFHEQGPQMSKRIWRMGKPGDVSSWEVFITIPSEDRGCPKRYLPLRNELLMVESLVDENLMVYILDANKQRKLEKKLKGDDNQLSLVHACLASLVSPSYS